MSEKTEFDALIEAVSVTADGDVTCLSLCGPKLPWKTGFCRVSLEPVEKTRAVLTFVGKINNHTEDYGEPRWVQVEILRDTGFEVRMADGYYLFTLEPVEPNKPKEEYEANSLRGRIRRVKALMTEWARNNSSVKRTIERYVAILDGE